MVDREKVIKGLRCHVYGCPHTRCHKCPYWGTGPHGSSECEVLASDALSMLNAQAAELEELKRDYADVHEDLQDTLKNNLRLQKMVDSMQELRILSLKDLRSIGSVWEFDTPPYLWMDINPSYKWERGAWEAWRDIFDMIDGLCPTYDADNYNKIWRVWSFRPTNEQREAIPWQS